jgi:anti-sigma factor RsiW
VSREAAASPSPECAEVARWIEPYVDGELTGSERAGTAEIDRHLLGCAACAKKARQQAAFKAALKAAAPRPALPDGMRDRVKAAIARERPAGAVPPWRHAAGRAAPAVAAAAVVATLMGTTHRQSPVAADAISNHRRALPIEVAGSADQVRDWFSQKVDFAVRPPVMPSATLVGARLAHIRDRQAAYLVYNVSGNRVSVFLFDPADLPIDARRHRTAAGRDVFLEEKGGYHVALLRNGGLGYAFASDLDEDRMFQLVSSAVSR